MSPLKRRVFTSRATRVSLVHSISNCPSGLRTYIPSSSRGVMRPSTVTGSAASAKGIKAKSENREKEVIFIVRKMTGKCRIVQIPKRKSVQNLGNSHILGLIQHDNCGQLFVFPFNPSNSSIISNFISSSLNTSNTPSTTSTFKMS